MRPPLAKPPRLLTRFAIYTAWLLLAAGVAYLFIDGMGPTRVEEAEILGVEIVGHHIDDYENIPLERLKLRAGAIEGVLTVRARVPHQVGQRIEVYVRRSLRSGQETILGEHHTFL
jgi:hypothetical protein